ncbi:MAG: CRTAC1 family protein [Actinobacteria bacterium]|nr:CRTAC1 family protein [Actinomycetota bacterium]
MREPRGGDGIGLRAATLAAVIPLLMSSPGSSSTGAPTGVTVTLTPTGPTSLPQGRSFEFRAAAYNPDPEPVSLSVILQLEPSGAGEDPVAFRTWKATFPPGETTFLDVEVPPSQWFDGIGPFHVVPLVRGDPIGDQLRLEVTAPEALVPLFEDVTEAVGLETSLPPSQCGMKTAGAAWGDIDADADLDLFVPVRGETARLWVNDGAGSFVDEASARGIAADTPEDLSAVFADYDNDGDQDLFVVSYSQANHLYRNDGSGRFVDVAAAAGIAPATAGSSANWGDYDSDGYLDLYVTDHVICGEPADPQPDWLYHNEGDGTFTDRTELLPASATDGTGFQATWFDYDGDGDQDLYLGNDYFGPDRDGNHLWRNDGPGPGDSWTFTDVSAESGTVFEVNTMGIAVGDYDRDMDLDFALSDVAGNVLARNNGDGTFADVATSARAERVFQHAGRSSITWGLGFYDFNLDGWEDLYVAAGSLGSSIDQPNQLFVNSGDGSFLDLSAPSGMTDPSITRGVAFGDYDRDGRIDIYELNQGGSPSLYRNATPMSGLHWLEVDLVGRLSNRDGCGARLTIVVAGGRMTRPVLCGASLGTGSDTVVHFGLGSARRVSRLIVDWPSGRRQVMRDLRGDQLVTVTEPNSG